MDRFERMSSTLGPCELVRGEVVRMSPGGVEHSRVEARIVGSLWEYARRTKLGQVLSGEAGIVVERDPDTVRGADVLYISYKRLPAGRTWTGFLRQRPELVVEVLGQKDTWEAIDAKIGECHAFGVDVVWVADPQTRTLRVHPKSGKPAILHDADELTGGKLLPGYRAKVREFFQD